MIQIKIPGGKCLTSLRASHVATGSPTLKLACSRIERSRLAKGLGFCFLPFTVHPFTPPPLFSYSQFTIHTSRYLLPAPRYRLFAASRCLLSLPLLDAAPGCRLAYQNHRAVQYRRPIADVEGIGEFKLVSRCAPSQGIGRELEAFNIGRKC
jgi:hypothetical protein